MTNLTVDYLSKQDLPLSILKVKDIIYFVFRSFTLIAQRLLLLDRQILNYKNQNAHFDKVQSMQYKIQSDFFYSIQTQRKIIERELVTVNSIFNEQRQQAEHIFSKVGAHQMEQEYQVYMQKKKDNLIHFPRLAVDDVAVDDVCNLFKRGEVFALKVNNQKKEVFSNVNQAIVVMRERFK